MTPMKPDGVPSRIEHTVPVSETLKEGAAEQNAAARRATERERAVREGRAGGASALDEPLEEQHGPAKVHGDALEAGSGTRQGRTPDEDAG